MFAAVFDFYGVILEIRSLDEISHHAMCRISEDFRFFAKPGQGLGRAKVHFNLHGSKLPRPLYKQKGRYAFKTRMCSVYGWNSFRLCDFGESIALRALKIKGKRVFDVFCDRPDELYEISLMAILSAVGEELDRSGLHRIHALGFSAGTQSAIFIAGQGGGKSSLATKLLSNDRLKIYSDECPLLDRKLLLPFPFRIALHQTWAARLGADTNTAAAFRRRLFPSKLLFPIPHAKVAAPAPVHFLFLAKRSKGPARINPASPLKVFTALFSSLVVGNGLPQMAEYMLRFNNLFALIKIAFSRLWTALLLLNSCKFYEIELSEDFQKNADEILKFFKIHSGKEISAATLPLAGSTLRRTPDPENLQRL